MCSDNQYHNVYVTCYWNRRERTAWPMRVMYDYHIRYMTAVDTMLRSSGLKVRHAQRCFATSGVAEVFEYSKTDSRVVK